MAFVTPKPEKSTEIRRFARAHPGLSLPFTGGRLVVIHGHPPSHARRQPHQARCG
jgi:hypothetical protein